ncbi:hypothetical protein ACOSQ2_002677 [Xanthoceras sorbifolium]
MRQKSEAQQESFRSTAAIIARGTCHHMCRPKLPGVSRHRHHQIERNSPISNLLQRAVAKRAAETHQNHQQRRTVAPPCQPIECRQVDRHCRPESNLQAQVSKTQVPLPNFKLRG